eukprot:TRINITY_DN260_c0_g2_i1.p1 TRINITY_DN260_c0_g2~~TRINITY_DN260_c0_g2_i1.p1  ORF type:complete len:312 (+),score=-23.85 TRINITY_DN260_c0_g2_i1:234-1169(+)
MQFSQKPKLDIYSIVTYVQQLYYTVKIQFYICIISQKYKHIYIYIYTQYILYFKTIIKQSLQLPRNPITIKKGCPQNNDDSKTYTIFLVIIVIILINKYVIHSTWIPTLNIFEQYVFTQRKQYILISLLNNETRFKIFELHRQSLFQHKRQLTTHILKISIQGNFNRKKRQQKLRVDLENIYVEQKQQQILNSDYYEILFYHNYTNIDSQEWNLLTYSQEFIYNNSVAISNQKQLAIQSNILLGTTFILYEYDTNGNHIHIYSKKFQIYSYLNVSIVIVERDRFKTKQRRTMYSLNAHIDMSFSFEINCTQ